MTGQHGVRCCHIILNRGFKGFKAVFNLKMYLYLRKERNNCRNFILVLDDLRKAEGKFSPTNHEIIKKVSEYHTLIYEVLDYFEHSSINEK